MFLFLLGIQPAFAVPGPEVTAPVASPPALTYKVKKGDSLYRIAGRAKISVATLMRLNRLSSSKIKPGQVLLLGEAPAAAAAETGAKISPSVLDELRSEASTLSPLLEKPVLSLLAAPYRFGGTSAKGIDCSGFVQQVFKELNFDLPRSAREQYRLGDEVAAGELQTGDLLFFRTYAKYPSHVGIYLGNNKMLHASTRSRRVVVSDIETAYFRSRYIGARRLALNHEGSSIDSLFSAEVDEEVEDGSMEAVEIGADEAVEANTNTEEGGSIDEMEAVGG